MDDAQRHPARDRLESFGRGELELNEIDAVQQHLADCAACCAVLDETPDDDLLAVIRRVGRDSDFVAGLMDPARAETAFAPSSREPDAASWSAGEELGIAGSESAVPSRVPRELAEHERYRVVGLTGTGGMGVVYKAEHRLMRRLVALKIIHRELTADPHAVERFQREVRAAASLTHENIVAAYDAERAGEIHFLAMEYVEGTDLAAVVEREGPLPVAAACEYVLQTAAGLQHAHERGMVHRDIKPHNLMLTDGRIKILDFGLASLTENPGRIADSPTDFDHDLPQRAELTAVGAVMGTPDYISPEQTTDARSVDIRSDIYSLGATLYFLLTGRPPFSEGTVMDTLKSHAEHDPERVDSVRVEVPSAVADVVARMMAKEPADRFQTPAELADALAPFVDKHRSEPAVGPAEAGTGDGAEQARSVRRVLLATAVILAATAIVSALYVAFGDREQPIDESGGKVVAEKINDPATHPPTPDGAIINSIGMRLVPLPKGEFVMGSPESETGRTKQERQHRVRITRSIHMGVCEVTQAEYTRVIGSNPSAFSSSARHGDLVRGRDTSRFAVENITWQQAVEFCRLLSERPAERNAGLVYRLPTEAEWEYACRAGTTTTFHFGDDANGTVANVDGSRPYGTDVEGPALGRPTVVGKYGPNGFGLYDLHGNVQEWCGDWFAPDYYANSAVDDPTGPPATPSGFYSGTRVLRGGSWQRSPAFARAAFRSYGKVSHRDPATGFRVVCEIADGREASVAALAAIAAIDAAGARFKIDRDNALVNVSFNGPRFGDADLAHLEGADRLHSLYLPGTRVTNAGVKEHVSRLTALRNLYLVETAISNAGLEHLHALPNLAVLYLDGTAVSDDGVEHLAALTGLGALSLKATAVTESGAQKLRKALPRCDITR